jgi:hypothetical protein
VVTMPHGGASLPFSHHRSEHSCSEAGYSVFQNPPSGCTLYRDYLPRNKQVQVKKSFRIAKKHVLLCASAKSPFRRSGTVRRLWVCLGVQFSPQARFWLSSAREFPFPARGFKRLQFGHFGIMRTDRGVGMTDSNFSPQLFGVRVQRLFHHSLANSCEGFVASLFPPETLSYSVPPALCKSRTVRAWRAAITFTLT